MKIFLTGGTGFIGSHFLNAVLSRGHQVVALRRLGSCPRVALKYEPEWIDASMDSLPNGIFDGCEALVHFAAHSANLPYDTLEKCIYWNMNVSLDLLKRAASSGVGRFLVAGSCFEYGKSGEKFEYIPVNAPLEPTQTYPISKACGAVALNGWARLEGARLSYHRIFQVYGEGEADNRLWPSLYRAAVSGQDFPMTFGEQVRDFIPVEDVAQTFLSFLEKTPPAPGNPEIHNVGSGQPQTLREFAEFWWKKWGATGKLKFGEIPYREGEVMRYAPEILK